ncbi:alpha/beta fold hydrolase [Oricola nitratireducens]|uniref:alpha/beta fold hydrolase n=1 Tax=Oricola nitratireducens TaxID=2775868 RepID=UPI001867EB2B|nr:alpha/beta hydrolase [Oricola nitratireducens]
MGFSETRTHASATGAALALRHQPAKGKAAGVVHILHGLAEHSARYAAFAQVLSAAGYHVYAHDHRGHGFTQAPGAPAGSFDTGGDGVRLVLDDVSSVQDMIAASHPGLPLILFGHSMGGTVALAHAFRHADRIAGCVAWNASLTAGLAGRAAKAVLAWERFRLGSDVPSVLLPKLTFGAWAKSVKDRRTEFDWLSRDVSVVDAYIADPLCGWPASVGMWSDILDMVFEVTDVGNAPAKARRLPYHLLGGGRDPATAFGKAVKTQAERMRSARFDAVTLRLRPEMRHETLNEVGREEAIGELLDWLRVKVPAG